MTLLASQWMLEFHSGIPVYMQIMHHVQAAVAAGRLKEGDQLPTIRALREKLEVNPNTVAKAYRELQHLGIITAEQDRKSTRLNSSHLVISYAVFCLK